MFTKHSGVALLGSLSMLSTAPAAQATDAIPPAAASPAVAADTLIPIESFFKNCSFSGAILSPDGHLAVRVAQAEGGSGRPLGLRYETDAQWQLGRLLGRVRKLPPIRHARADRRPRQGCHQVQGHLAAAAGSRQRTSPNAAISARQRQPATPRRRCTHAMQLL